MGSYTDSDGKALLCLDMESRAVLWRLELPYPISDIWITKDNRLVVRQENSVAVLASLTGKTLYTKPVPGPVFGMAADGAVYCKTKEGDIVCILLDSGEERWRFNIRAPDSNIHLEYFEPFVFVLLRPRTIVSRMDGQGNTTSMEGLNKLICLSAGNGAVLWKEDLPLSKAAFAASIQVQGAAKWILCATDKQVRLMNRQTGKVMRVFDSPEDINGVDFWGDKHIALCLGGFGAESRTVQILDVNNFAVQSEFSVAVDEVAFTRVVGNVLILESLYHHVGVDMVSGKVIWKVGQIWWTLHQDNLIFGGHTGGGRDMQRVLGILDPKTGKMTLLHSEEVVR